MIFIRLFLSYLVIGLFGFGGGYAMLALIENEVVAPGWITEKTFTDIVAISQMTPGPIGINSATYIGYVAPQNNGFEGWGYGLAGSLLCTLVVVIPSFLLVTFASHYIARHHESATIKGVFAGLRPAVVGLIASAALILMNGANFGTVPGEILISSTICVIVLCTSLFVKLHPIWLIIAAGFAGYLIY